MPSKFKSSHTAASSKLKKQLSTTRFHLQEFAAFVDWATSGKQYMDIEDYQDWRQRQILKEQRERLYELRRRTWIEVETIGKRVIARLTEQGWERALRDRIRCETKKCAGGICIIVFDIPEKQRLVRNLLRDLLKEWGFKRLQHSVWVTEKDVLEPVMLLLQRRKLNRWIRVIQGTILTPRPFDVIRAHRG